MKNAVCQRLSLAFMHTEAMYSSRWVVFYGSLFEGSLEYLGRHGGVSSQRGNLDHHTFGESELNFHQEIARKRKPQTRSKAFPGKVHFARWLLRQTEYLGSPQSSHNAGMALLISARAARFALL